MKHHAVKRRDGYVRPYIPGDEYITACGFQVRWVRPYGLFAFTDYDEPTEHAAVTDLQEVDCPACLGPWRLC